MSKKEDEMITQSENTISFINEMDHIVDSLNQNNTPSWLNEIRNKNQKRLDSVGFPNTKNEEWKYTNIKSILSKSYEFQAEANPKSMDKLKKYLDENSVNLVFINGKFTSEYSFLNIDSPGITISTLENIFNSKPELIKDLLEKQTLDSSTSFVALNNVLVSDGNFIHLGANTIYDKLIHIIHVKDTQGKHILTSPRTVIKLEKSSEATVLESHLSFSDDDTYFTNALTDIYLGENATLHYCKAQAESMKAYHIGTTRVWQERNSNFDGFSLMTGGAITRNDLDIILGGEGCHCTLNGLYSVNHDQHVDNHTSVDHQFPNCTSNQLYKGILNGASRGVFNGKIFVKKIAQQTNSYQLNKNLLLGKDARIDTKPQLEIFADDVKCTHGATISQLNEDEIFYLRSRCIPKKKAISLLSHGFVDDIINTIPNKAIRSLLNELLQPTFSALDYSPTQKE